MKKWWLSILPILLINFVSAFTHYGYNRFSITGFFSSINPDDIIFVTSFMIVFVITNYALGKFLKDSYGNPNKPVTGIISLSVALLAAYSLFRTGFDLSGLFYNIGISEGTLFFILPIILLIAAVIIIFTLNVAALFLIFGLLMILITRFTDLIYEKGIALLIGGVLSLIGAVWLWKKRRGGYDYGGGRGIKGKWWLILGILVVIILVFFTGNTTIILVVAAIGLVILLIWLIARRSGRSVGGVSSSGSTGVGM